jgi:site-specific DNA-cytosine methylase
VPTDVDMLVAGFSCVDFSNLNYKKQDLESGGESGDTFRAVYNYAKYRRPTLIVLENVCGAPWEKLIESFDLADYDALHARLDTKHYYLPHTRIRGYMICLDRRKVPKSQRQAEMWKKNMGELARHASSSIEAFLLDEDDPRVHRGRAELSKGALGGEKGPREVDWTKCQGRHQDYRADLLLGSKRPLTAWEDNGSCRMPDYAWGDWGAKQVERIWDTFEISFLRNVRRGYDSQYKT